MSLPAAIGSLNKGTVGAVLALARLSRALTIFWFLKVTSGSEPPQLDNRGAPSITAVLDKENVRKLFMLTASLIIVTITGSESLNRCSMQAVLVDARQTCHMQVHFKRDARIAAYKLKGGALGQGECAFFGLALGVG
jgi:hypothetical protein